MSAQKRLDELGSLQRIVIEQLWERGEATVHELRDALAAEAADDGPAYTTVLTVLQKLEKAGWVEHRKDGRTYVYRTVRSRRQAGTSSLRSFVDRVFRGDRLLLLEHLLDDEALDPETLAGLRELIEQKRGELDQEGHDDVD